MATVTFKGNPLTLVGNEVNVGDQAPDFNLRKGLAPDSEYTLASDAGKVRIISAVPSLDTPVCATETQKFNDRAGELPEGTVLITVSVDLPVAMGRFCLAQGIDKVVTASDYYDHSFGTAYGIRVKELGVLARCIFVIDGTGTVTYKQLVGEITDEPDYDAVIAAAQAAGG